MNGRWHCSPSHFCNKDIVAALLHHFHLANPPSALLLLILRPRPQPLLLLSCSPLPSLLLPRRCTHHLHFFSISFPPLTNFYSSSSPPSAPLPRFAGGGGRSSARMATAFSDTSLMHSCTVARMTGDSGARTHALSTLFSDTVLPPFAQLLSRISYPFYYRKIYLLHVIVF